MSTALSSFAGSGSDVEYRSHTLIHYDEWHTDVSKYVPPAQKDHDSVLSHL